MHIYDELKEIKAPDKARSDGLRVYIEYGIGNGRTKRIYIGYFTDKENRMMHVNDNFRRYCPDLWEQSYGKDRLPHYMYGVGMYAMTLALAHRNRMYPALHDSFGPLCANALLDFAMYSIMERSNVAYRFKPAMEHQVIFSKSRMDDAQLSEMFGSQISADMIHKFMLEWLAGCRERGVVSAYISIDGSNSDCECTSTVLNAKTENKSGLDKEAVSYMYAVNADDGMPLAFSTYYGDMVDAKAMRGMAELLRSAGITVEGVILDKGFLTHDAIVLLNGLGLDFVIRLKSDTHAATQMVIRHGDDIYWNIGSLIGRDGRFGVSGGLSRIFGEYEETAYVSLYFDAVNATGRKVAFTDKMYDAMQAAFANPDESGRPRIPADCRKYLEVEEDPGSPGRFRIVPADICNRILHKKGFSCIATSRDLGAIEADRVYRLRDSSEKQFMVMKSMLGQDVFRAHSTEGILTRGFICFIASIIRCEISNACKALGMKPALMLPQVERPMLAFMANGTYKYIANTKEAVNDLFAYVGVTEEDFETIAADVNEREAAANGHGVSQYHRTPAEIREAHRRGREANKAKAKAVDEEIETSGDDLKIERPRVIGRPKGSRNKKTLAREAELKKQGIDPGQKRSRGRPKGSRNKKTLERIEKGEIPAEPSKRGRGRPKGRKDSKPRKRRTKKELEALRAANQG